MARGGVAAIALSGLARWSPVLVAGVVVGTLMVILEISFAALIFSGPLEHHLPTGIAILLGATIVLSLVIGWLSGLPGMVSIPQDTVAAVTALMAASVVAEVGDGRVALMTIVALMMVSSLAAGALFAMLGGLRLGNFVRFLPYPVIGGFLAGTGWLLLDGSLGVMANVSMTTDPAAAFAWHALSRWGSGVGFAVLLLLVSRRATSAAAIPLALLAGMALFYFGLLVTGTGIGAARDAGWLLGPFPEAGGWRPLSVSALGEADWRVVAGRLGDMATLMVLALVALLMNASGIELALRRDVDLNRELRGAGVANVGVGLLGGMGGYQALSLTVLGRRLGTESRAIGLVAAAVLGLTLLGGDVVLGVFPRPILGGLLALLGLGFLYEWVVDARRRLPPADYVIVLAILATIVTIGFLQGVAVGLLAAILLFVVKYSRADVVKHELDGSAFRSSVDRPEAHRELLGGHGRAIRILELQGFVFFGTGERLLRVIRAMLEEDPTVRFVVLDLRRVTGLDSSVVMSFDRARQVCETHGATLVLTAVPAAMRRRFEHGGIVEGEWVRFFDDLDHGTEWCEDHILLASGMPPHDVGGATALPTELSLRRFRAYLEPLDVGPGTPIIRQGEPAESLYFIESGRMTVVLEVGDGSTKRLRRLLPGTLVGEVGFYLGETRTSSVVAEEDCRVHRLTREALERMKKRNPKLAAEFHLFLSRLLARRLADATRMIDALIR